MPDTIKDITAYEAHLIMKNILLEKEKCKNQKPFFMFI